MTRRITRGSTKKADGSARLKARRSSSILGPLTFDTVNHRHIAEIDFSVVHYTFVLSESSGVWWRNFHLVSGTVLAAGGNYGESWSADRILKTADAAVGQTVLTELYQRLKDSPEPADLDGLWRSLGVAGGTLNDDAPLAKVRRAILS